MPDRQSDRQRSDRAWAQYSQAFRTQVMPQLLASEIFLGVYDRRGDGGQQEIQFATSLGLMLLHGKPIILARLPGQSLPERLVRCADEVVELDLEDEGAMASFADAIDRVKARLGPAE